MKATYCWGYSLPNLIASPSRNLYVIRPKRQSFSLPKSTISASEQEGINFKTQPLTWKLFVTIYNAIDLFSLYVLFSQYMSRDNTLGNRFFQISSYSRAYLLIIYEKTMGQVPLGPLLGKQNIRASVRRMAIWHWCPNFRSLKEDWRVWS